MTEIKNSLPMMLGIKEVCELTGLSNQFIRTLCKTGKVTYVKSGWKYLVNVNSLNRYLNTGDGNE